MRICALRFFATAALSLTILISACSDDHTPTGGGGPDTTPPSVVSVTPVDEYHVNVLFNERMSVSAQSPNYYTIVQTGASRTSDASLVPDAAPQLTGVVLLNDEQTVAITTAFSMAGHQYTISIGQVEDLSGNRIETPIERPFMGSSDADVTPPELVRPTPEPGSSNLPLNTYVTMQFSEPLDFDSFWAGATWTVDGGGVVDAGSSNGLPEVSCYLYHHAPLELGTKYTISLHGIRDPAGNVMPDTQWSFVTVTSGDHTPPSLLSTSPINLETSVDVNTAISLNFSEPLLENFYRLTISPQTGGFTLGWDNDGKTITIHPLQALQDDQQYELSILDGGVSDLAGNGIVGLHTVVFSTGPALNNGSIGGTITGDPGSQAADPSGAVVMATQNQGSSLGAIANVEVKGNNTYLAGYLPDGVYYPLAVMDTNHDGYLSPLQGDAVGAYGVNSWPASQLPDSVVITGGNHATNISFSIFDPSAITGRVTYGGVQVEGQWTAYVGLFDTPGFDPSNSPVAVDVIQWPITNWRLLSFDDGFPDGTYYVGAVIDANMNGFYDPASDPAGFYGGINSPTPLNVQNGADFLDILLPLADPAPGLAAAPVVWPAEKHNAAFERILELLPEGDVKPRIDVSR